MNQIKSREPLHGFGRMTIITATSLCLAATSASAAEKTYQYYRFLPVKAYGNNDNIQLSEFTLSRNGTVLNINNRDGSGTAVVPVTLSSGGQDPNEGEGPNKLLDNNTGSKWFKGNPFSEAEALIFSFTAPVTIDSYNWASANDSVEYWRNPVSWRFYGSTNGTTWDLLDSRSDFGIINANETYQAGFTLQDEVAPSITSFGVSSTSAAIIINGSSIPLSWDTEEADATVLDPGSVAGPADGSANPVPTANETTNYILTATRTGTSDTATASTNVRTVVGGSATYRYVRFHANKLRNGTDEGLIQLGEFGFLNGATPVPVQSVTNPGGFSFGGEGVENLIDGNGVDNKWLDFNNAPVIFDFGASPPTFNRYFFYTGNDAPDRDPLRWTLEGSNNGTSWTLIENVDFDYPTPATRKVTSNSIPLPGTSIAPLLESFTGSAATLILGQPFSLSWRAGGGTIVIDNGVGTVPEFSSVAVNPPLGETTYNITVTSPGGLHELTSSFTVNVVPQPPINTINYADFSSSGEEMTLRGPSAIVNGRLRLTPEVGSLLSESWFRLVQPVSDGFEATFGLSMNRTALNGVPPADGIAFVIQNDPAGSNAPSDGDPGLPANALNIRFQTFGFDAHENSRVSIRAGTTVLAQASVELTPGLPLVGMPGFPDTLATMASDPPYRVRIVYVAGDPGQIDVYINGVAVLQNVAVDLAGIGAVNANGDAYLGFTARTGGYYQNNDITDWHMRYGDFSALPAFGMVSSGSWIVGGQRYFDLVWNSELGVSYRVESSPDLTPASWNFVQGFDGIEGQVGVRLPVFDEESKLFYRVVEEE